MAHRYFVPDLPASGPCTLHGELAHHLGRVLRVRPGETLVLGDGAGGTANAVVRDVGKDRIACEITGARREPAPALQVTVAFAVPRLPRVEWLLEHGTEIGVAVFQPLWTARTRPQGERAERWQRIVTAAAGQCDRAWLPEVRAARELPDLLADPQLAPQRLLAAQGAPALAGAAPPIGEVVLLVGPEGGFTPPELAAIAAAGFAPRSFARHTLRTETAALVGAAVLLAQ